MRKPYIALATISLTMFGCVEGGNLGSEVELTLIRDDAARLSTGKFRLMAAKSGKNQEITSAEIQVTGLEVRSVSGEFFRYAVEPFVLDLFALKRGGGSVLARIKLPPGEYDLVRFQTEAFGHAVVNGNVVELKVPSGPQSGLKVFFEPALRVGDDQLTVAVMELDDKESFVVTGAGPVLFKPVLKVRVTQAPPVEEPADPTHPADPGTPPGDSGDTGDTGNTGDTNPGDDGDVDSGDGDGGDDDGEDHGDDGEDHGDDDDDVFIPWIGI